ncbi:hypothetical protein LTS18_001558 [Coniosporium uncinatum]|uniref:Uncharacterized protein n=1 Tax=Coniosporium uncinatum TaxID=93489 RepID=A0ACC3D7Z2_9PEZI|nr:hypothetical protein LTS18_001558 [Coniosporium uncinatum]
MSSPSASKKRETVNSSPDTSDMSPAIVKIIVGDPAEGFSTEKDLICARSKTFKAAFEGGSTKCKFGEMTLKGVSASTFKSFKHWLYYNDINFDSSDSAKGFIDNFGAYRCIDLFAFADGYDVPALRNMICNFVLTKHAENAYRR